MCPMLFTKAAESGGLPMSFKVLLMKSKPFCACGLNGVGEGDVAEGFTCGVAVLAARGGSEGLALAFGTNLLKRSLSVMVGNTFNNSSNNTLAVVVILVRERSGV